VIATFVGQISNLPLLMPASGYRKTYFASVLSKTSGVLVFGALLQHLAPRTYARLREFTPYACLLALCAHINAHCFPLADFALAEMEANDGRDADEWSYTGMPVLVFGCDWYDERYTTAEPTATALCLTLSGLSDTRFPILEEYDDTAWRNVNPTTIRQPILPRDRAWTYPWAGAWDLYTWANGETGLPVLDYTDTMLAEGGLPQWSMDEIAGLSQQWKIAKPMLERIAKLWRFVDARPAERLPLLAGALTNDRAVIERITEKRRVPKTLAEMWR
jgi:hypothetical protein